MLPCSELLEIIESLSIGESHLNSHALWCFRNKESEPLLQKTYRILLPLVRPADCRKPRKNCTLDHGTTARLSSVLLLRTAQKTRRLIIKGGLKKCGGHFPLRASLLGVH
jgi:hypothetical protein